jgi:hypothetical protein
VRKADNLHVPMARNVGALTSRNPVGLFRPVMGQLYCEVHIKFTLIFVKFSVRPCYIQLRIFKQNVANLKTVFVTTSALSELKGTFLQIEFMLIFYGLLTT